MLRTPLLVPLAFLVMALPAIAQSTGSLTGRVIDDLDQPVPGVTIRLVGTTLGSASRYDGSFRIDGIAPGDYTVLITAAGYLSDSISVHIEIGTVREIEIGVKAIHVGDSILIIPPSYRLRPSPLLDSKSRTTIPAVVDLQSGVTYNDTIGFSIRGANPSQTELLIDGVAVGDPFRGGFAGTNAELYPTIPLSALDAFTGIQVRTGSDEVQYGNTLSGLAMASTRSGREDRIRGEFRFRTDVGALYGWSSMLAVRKAGSNEDTTLPAAKAMNQGNRLYEFNVYGPIHDTRLSFDIAGRYNSFEHYSAGYETYDLSPEYAETRRTVATELNRPPLTPTNLGAIPNTSAMVYDLRGRIRIKMDIGEEAFVDIIGEHGGMRREFGEWNQLYMVDRPAFRDVSNGVFTIDQNAGYLERNHQTVNRNTTINSIGFRFFEAITQQSQFDLKGTYSIYQEETGRKDVSRSYGPFEMYDIYRPVDNGAVTSPDAAFVSGTSNSAIDRYETVVGTITLNPYSPSNFTVLLRNPLTGFYEGGETSGASNNPYGLTDMTFPAHGATRGFEFREAQITTANGIYTTALMIGNTSCVLNTGFDLDITTLRRHQNSLPWDQSPFFDVYGYQAGYFAVDTANTPSIHNQPFTPISVGLHTSADIRFGDLLIRPGIRLDLFDPNLPESLAPASPEEITTKLFVSPRIAASYRFADGMAQIRTSIAMLQHRPEFVLLYDNNTSETAQEGQIAGNPNLDFQHAIVSELGCEAYLMEKLYLDIVAYYRSVSRLPTVLTGPRPFPQYYSTSSSETEGIFGTQLSIDYRPVDHVEFNVNYTLQSATRSAEQIITPTVPSLPALIDVPLNTDRTHTLHGSCTFSWGNSEGPAIGGIRPLENSVITLTGSFFSGLPYTLENTRGEQLSDINELRLPSVFETEAHLEKNFRMADIVGEGLGDTEIGFFADIFNIFNSTDAISIRASRATGGALYAVAADADNNGLSMNLQQSDFSATPFFRAIDPSNAVTYSATQYDRFGNRLYNPYADTNLDGVVTQQEKYEGYQRYVAALQSQRSTYQFPRQVHVGIKVRF